MAQRFTENCHKLGLDDSWRFHRRPARRDAPDLAQDHRIRQEAGCRNHPGFARPRLPRHGILRTRQGKRTGQHRGHDGLGRPSASQRRLSGIRSRRTGGMGGTLLLGILLPSQGRVARGFERRSQQRHSAPLQRSARISVRQQRRARSSSRNRKKPPRRSGGPRAALRKWLAAVRPWRTVQPAIAISGSHAIDFKTKLLTVFVVLTNVLGNFSMSWGMKHQAADLGLSPLALHPVDLHPWVLLGTDAADFLAAVANDAARLGGFELRAAGDLHRLRLERCPGQSISSARRLPGNAGSERRSS